LSCDGCTYLMSLPDLLLCTDLRCGGCTSLVSLPDLPVCTILYCFELPYLTHISISAECIVICFSSPIAGHNNNLYLSYINTCRSIIASFMDKSCNYEKGILSIIMGYI
jgi:hypothetical protein